MERLALKTLEDLVNSKYGGRERTQRNLDKITLANGKLASDANLGKPANNHASPPDRYQPSRPRVALITGDENAHPGILIPAGFFDTEGASSESS
jgi:hypothetical protein